VISWQRPLSTACGGVIFALKWELVCWSGDNAAVGILIKCLSSTWRLIVHILNRHFFDANNFSRNSICRDLIDRNPSRWNWKKNILFDGSVLSTHCEQVGNLETKYQFVVNSRCNLIQRLVQLGSRFSYCLAKCKDTEHVGNNTWQKNNEQHWDYQLIASWVDYPVLSALTDISKGINMRRVLVCKHITSIRFSFAQINQL